MFVISTRTFLSDVIGALGEETLASHQLAECTPAGFADGETKVIVCEKGLSGGLCTHFDLPFIVTTLYNYNTINRIDVNLFSRINPSL